VSLHKDLERIVPHPTTIGQVALATLAADHPEVLTAFALAVVRERDTEWYQLLRPLRVDTEWMKLPAWAQEPS